MYTEITSIKYLIVYSCKPSVYSQMLRSEVEDSINNSLLSCLSLELIKKETQEPDRWKKKTFQKNIFAHPLYLTFEGAFLQLALSRPQSFG